DEGGDAGLVVGDAPGQAVGPDVDVEVVLGDVNTDERGGGFGHGFGSKGSALTRAPADPCGLAGRVTVRALARRGWGGTHWRSALVTPAKERPPPTTDPT